MLKNFNWDKLGMSASFICALHCALAPLILPVMALWGLGFIWGEAVEIGMLLFALAVGVFSLTKSYRQVHRKFYPFYFLVGGIGLIFISHSSLPHVLEPFVLPIGALLIVFAHWLNYRLCKNCPVCESSRSAEVASASAGSSSTMNDTSLKSCLTTSESVLIIKNEESL